MSNEHLKAWQRTLAALRLNTGPIDGIWGPLTAGATRVAAEGGLATLRAGTATPAPPPAPAPVPPPPVAGLPPIPKVARRVTEIILHCTATPGAFMTGASTAARVAEVRRWHTTPPPNGRGWSDIGYHYLIDRDGTVAAGRPLDRVGAHTLDRNEGTIGVSLFGGLDSASTDSFADNFTPAQDASLRRLIAAIFAVYGPLAISGHNQWAAKACPGFNAPAWFRGA